MRCCQISSSESVLQRSQVTRSALPGGLESAAPPSSGNIGALCFAATLLHLRVSCATFRMIWLVAANCFKALAACCRSTAWMESSSSDACSAFCSLTLSVPPGLIVISFAAVGATPRSCVVIRMQQHKLCCRQLYAVVSSRSSSNY